MQEELRIIYKYKSIEECADIWIAICSVLKQENLLSEKYEIDDRGFKTIDKIAKILNDETNFGIEDQLFSFSFGGVAAAKLQQLIISLEQNIQINWDIWIEKLSKYGKFTYAWKYNANFSYWQNNDSIDSYKRHGLSYEHLPIKPSGQSLPFPQIVIDTSQNPGRQIFRTGYVEAVGSTMWLGDGFFELIGDQSRSCQKGQLDGGYRNKIRNNEDKVTRRVFHPG